MSITTQTQVIDQADFAAVQAAVEKANKKAAKIGVPGYVATWGPAEPREIKRWDPSLGAYKVIGHVDQVTATVVGEAPKYAGWTFVATLAWDGEDAVIRKVRGLDDIDTAPARANLKPLWCDHCNTARDRNETYLLHHEDGRFQQVGSTCLREFLGVEVNLALIGFNPYEGCDSTNRYTPSRYLTLGALEDTLAIVRRYGWVSASKAYNDSSLVSTKSRLEDAYSPEPDERNGRLTVAGEVREAIHANRHEDDAARAAEIVDWVRNVLVDDGNEYVGNLKASVGSAPEEGQYDTFRRDNLGIVISAVYGYQRWQEREQRKAQERSSAPNSEWVGTKGERLRGLALTVRSTRWVHSDWGSSLLVLFTDEAGNAFKWFASNPPTSVNLETDGQQVVLDATVKEHETYNDRKSTVLTRCTVKEVVASK